MTRCSLDRHIADVRPNALPLDVPRPRRGGRPRGRLLRRGRVQRVGLRLDRLQLTRLRHISLQRRRRVGTAQSAFIREPKMSWPLLWQQLWAGIHGRQSSWRLRLLSAT